MTNQKKKIEKIIIEWGDRNLFSLKDEFGKEAIDEIVNKVFALLSFSKEEWKKELGRKIEKTKVRFIENNFYGSEKDLDEKIEFETAYNQALDDILSLLK
jgi:hypothetical protein